MTPALRFPAALAAAGLLSVPGTAARADVFPDFDTLAHGEIVNSQYAALGISVSAVNPNRSHDLAAIYDTGTVGGADPDLEGPPWSSGNIDPDEDLGNLLIIAENDRGAEDGILDDPDDEGRRPAGSLVFDFDFRATEIGFDLVDVESHTLEDGGLTLFDGADVVLEFTWADLVSSDSDIYDATIAFGNVSANRLDMLEVADGFDRAVIDLGGSGAVGNLAIVPAPGTIALLGGGLVLAGRGRRRRPQN